MKTLLSWILIAGFLLVLALAVYYFPAPPPSSNPALAESPQGTKPSGNEVRAAAPNFTPGCQYNAQGQLEKIVYPDGSAYVCVYDAHGNKILETSPAGKSWAYTYDTNQRMTGMVGPDGQVRQMQASSGK